MLEIMKKLKIMKKQKMKMNLNKSIKNYIYLLISFLLFINLNNFFEIKFFIILMLYFLKNNI